MRKLVPVAKYSAALPPQVGPVSGAGSSRLITVLVEAENERLAHEHFECVVCDPESAGAIELSRGLYYACAQDSGRYWKFVARVQGSDWSCIEVSQQESCAS